MERKESNLIVDDDPSICATLARILVRKGYETDTAATGRKALEKIQDRSFNLTLLDIRLPDVVGMDLLRRLRESQSDMAVILVTRLARMPPSLLGGNSLMMRRPTAACAAASPRCAAAWPILSSKPDNWSGSAPPNPR